MKPNDFLLDISMYHLVGNRRGCYVLRDGNTDQILYVGKSVKLRERLGQYYNRSMHPFHNEASRMTQLRSNHPWIEVDVYYTDNCARAR